MSGVSVKSFKTVIPFVFEYDEYAGLISNKDESAQIADIFVAIRKALLKLTPEERSLMQKKFFFGYTAQDVAEEESITLAAANKRISRTETILYNYFIGFYATQ